MTPSERERRAIYFKFGERDLLVVYLGNGRYVFEWAGHQMIAEAPIAQSFIDWLLHVEEPSFSGEEGTGE